MQMQIIVQIATIVALALIVYRMYTINEKLCVNNNYGVVANVPYSNYPDANGVLGNNSSLGAAPLGYPKYWRGPNSPITQGMYGLYVDTPPIDETQPFDRASLTPISAEIPLYD